MPEVLAHRLKLLNDRKILSVLIPTVQQRRHLLARLLDNLYGQIGDRADIEVIALNDNFALSLGEKRNVLLGLASGEYLTFIDDDDDVSPDYIDRVTAAINENSGVDVLSVRAKCMVMNDTATWQRSHYMATTLLATHGNKSVDSGKKHYVIHRPWFWCLWRSDLAKTVKFPEKQWAEDNDWSIEMCGLAKTEAIVPSVLYYYYAHDPYSLSKVFSLAFPGKTTEVSYYESTGTLLRDHPEMGHVVSGLEDCP